jgi:hypothetical protein
MPHNSPLTFRVAGKQDYVFLALILFVLIVVSTALNPQPVMLIILSFVVCGAGWFVNTLDFSNLNDIKLISVIFPDGKVRIESGGEYKIEGILSGQQWCSHHVAVLRFATGGKHRYLVLFSVQQHVEEYRRLKVWLRQDFCTGTADKPASGIWPASRV